MHLDNQHHTSINPRMIAAIFFVVFALLFLFFAKYTLLSLKNNQTFPLLPSLGFSLICGTIAGVIAGNWLSKTRNWLKCFLMGILLGLGTLIILSICLFINAYSSDAFFFNQIHRWQDYFVIFGVIFLSMLFIIGLWLIPLTGLAAVYFNKRFFPGLVAVEKLRPQPPQTAVKPDDND